MTKFRQIIHIILFIALGLSFGIHKAIAYNNSDKLIVAFSELPPLKIIKNGTFEGPYAQIIRDIVKTLSLTPKFIECPLVRCLSFIKSGQADIIIGIKKDTYRSEYIHFLKTPIRVSRTKVFYIRKGAKTKVNKFEDLHKVGIIGTKAQAKYFERFDNDNTLIKYPVAYTIQNFEMLVRGRIDAIIIAKDQGEYFSSKPSFKENVELAEYFYKDYQHSYIGISKRSPYMKNIRELNYTVSKMSENGRLERIMRKYTY